MEDQRDTVLVVEDDAALRGSFRATLKRFGYGMAEAENGEVALQIAQAVEPAVILLDLRMPRMDGHTFLRRFDARNRDTVVVAMSGDGNLDDLIDLMRFGAVDFLKKPYTQSDLISVLGRAFELHGQRRAAKLAPPPASPAQVATTQAATQEATRGDDFAKLLERLRQGEIAIPSVPSVVFELRELMEDPQVSVTEIAALLERDQRLLAAVLRLGKTSQYAGLSKTADVATIVGRIGLREVHELVETTWLNDCFRVRDARYHDAIVQIWRHSIARAIAIRTLAQAAHLDGSSAYLGALFADIGACLLLWIAAEKSGTAALPPPSAMVPIIQTHHVTTGTLLLSKWKLDNDLVLRLVRSHHSEIFTDSYSKLFVLASDLARSLGAPDDLTTTAPPQDRSVIERCAQSLRIDETTRRKLVARIEQSYAETLAAIG